MEVELVAGGVVGAELGAVGAVVGIEGERRYRVSRSRVAMPA